MQQTIFIADLIACSTCFGHHYAHHQELRDCVSGLQPANRTHNPQLHTIPTTWKPKHQTPQAATTCIIQRVSKRMTRFQIIISNNENVLQLQNKLQTNKLSPQVSLAIIINALCALHLLHGQHQRDSWIVPNSSESVFCHWIYCSRDSVCEPIQVSR